jgi:hypothetical protein
MFQDQNYVCIFNLSHGCYIPYLSHPPWFCHPCYLTTLSQLHKVFIADCNVMFTMVSRTETIETYFKDQYLSEWQYTLFQVFCLREYPWQLFYRLMGSTLITLHITSTKSTHRKFRKDYNYFKIDSLYINFKPRPELPFLPRIIQGIREWRYTGTRTQGL